MSNKNTFYLKNTDDDGNEITVPVDTSTMSDAEKAALMQFANTGSISDEEAKLLAARKVYLRGDGATTTGFIVRFDWTWFAV